MKKKYTNFLRLTILIGSMYCLQLKLSAQTYATPELKAKVEKADAEKEKRMGISPTKEVGQINTSSIAAERAKKLALNPPPENTFKAISTYKLISMEPSALPGITVTEEETQRFRKAMKVSWIGSSLEFGTDNQLRFNKHSAIETRNGGQIIWVFKKDGCPTCGKRSIVQLVSEAPEKRVYLMDDEDAESKFQFRLTYIKQ